MADHWHPILRPVWVRLAVVAVPLLAAVWMFATGWVFLGAGLGLLGGVAFKRLILDDALHRNGEDGR